MSPRVLGATAPRRSGQAALRAMPGRGRTVRQRVLAALYVLCTAAAVSASGCGSDQAIVGGSCHAGYAQCGNQCVDLTSDPNNCGACGNACLPDIACGFSTCGLETVDGSPGSGGDDGVAPLDGLEGYGDRRAADVPAPDALESDATAPDAFADDGASIDSPPVDAATDSTAPAADSTPADDSGLDAAGADAGVADADAAAADADAAAADADAAAADADAAAADADAAAVNSDAAAVDADAALVCDPLMLACSGQCVDPKTDPLNCGDCNIKCISGLCQNSVCIGTTTGAVVFIGHDYATVPVSAQARVLSNAVFIPHMNPLNVLFYERYSDAAAITNLKTILTDAAQQVGRTLTVTETLTDSDVPTKLASQNFSALVVLDQPGAPHGALATLGASWAASVATFSQQGGVVVALDGATGTGEMPGFMTGTGLLMVTAHAPVTTGAPLSVLSRADAVGIGVVSPYAAGANTASITTEPNSGSVVYVVATSSDASSGAPVVVHKVF
jgi:Stigma-specific protein, Stig1